MSSPHREEKNWRFAHYLPVFDCREYLFHVVASRFFGDTSNEIFTSCGVKSPRGCFAVTILCFSPRHVRAPRSRRRRWERRRVGRKEKEEEREHKVSHDGKVESLESNRWFPRMLDSNWDHEEVPHESPARVWVFGSFFPFFSSPSLSLSLSLSRSVLSLSLSLPSCILFSLCLAIRVRSPGLRSLARSFALILRSWSSLSFLRQGRRLWAPQAPGKRSSHR